MRTMRNSTVESPHHDSFANTKPTDQHSQRLWMPSKRSNRTRFMPSQCGIASVLQKMLR